MDKKSIIARVEQFIDELPSNYVPETAAIRPELAGMRIYDAPVFAFGDPEDPLFGELKKPGVIGSHVLSPTEWLPGAKTVITFFLPYARRIKVANAANDGWPADEWLHGRYEGHTAITELTDLIAGLLMGAGYLAMVPTRDPRYKSGGPDGERFTSNWSLRHTAYICGLGTFGLSKGLITGKGVCGRIGAVITSLELPADVRPYSGLYDYCSMCGLCISRCPAKAISADEGKRHLPCSDFLDKVRDVHSPRYGCGKCQTGVPCESGPAASGFKKEKA